MVERKPVVGRYADKDDASSRDRGLSGILHAGVRPCGLEGHIRSSSTGLAHDPGDRVAPDDAQGLLVSAMNVAPDAMSCFMGLIGWSIAPVGSVFDLKPIGDVGDVCFFVSP